MTRRKKPRRTPAWMARLTGFSLTVAVIFTLSYASGAHIAVRYLDPPLGAWWNSNEFAIVECGAAALGMLIGIRIGARFVDDATIKRRSMVAAAIAAAFALPIVGRVNARVARFDFTSGARIQEMIVDRFRLDTGMFLDKLLDGGLYSIKMVAFALPVGMIFFAVALAIFMTAAPVGPSAVATSK